MVEKCWVTPDYLHRNSVTLKQVFLKILLCFLQKSFIVYIRLGSKYASADSL